MKDQTRFPNTQHEVKTPLTRRDTPRHSLPICMTLPNTELLSTVLQFHLLWRNWYWHSLIPVLAPSPMYCMWSWYKWQSFFCPWESPASWLHRGWAPIMYTSGIWTGFMGFMWFIPRDLWKKQNSINRSNTVPAYSWRYKTDEFGKCGFIPKYCMLALSPTDVPHGEEPECRKKKKESSLCLMAGKLKETTCMELSRLVSKLCRYLTMVHASLPPIFLPGLKFDTVSTDVYNLKIDMCMRILHNCIEPFSNITPSHTHTTYVHIIVTTDKWSLI